MAQDTASYSVQDLTLIGRDGHFWYPSVLNNRVSITEHKQDLSSTWSLPSGITHLLHLAADGSRDPYSDDAARSFIGMTENLIDWANRQTELRSIVHASSGVCSTRHTKIGGDSADETTIATKERFIQGRLKAESLLSQQLDKSLSLLIGRLYTFSGPLILLRNKYAVSSFVTAAVRDKKIQVRGNPHTVRTYLDQSDLGHWLLTMLQRNPSSSNPVLEIGSEIPVKIHELAEFISQETGAGIEYETTLEAADIYIPSTEQTREILHVRETIFWQDSVSRMIRLARTT